MPKKPAKQGNYTRNVPPIDSRFKPGQSGNPSGRPKGSVDIWSAVRRRLLEEIKRGPNKGRRQLDAVAHAIVAAARKGRWPQTKELLDREHGKPADTVDHGGTIRVEVTYRPVLSSTENGNGRIAEHANGNGHSN